MQKETLLNLCRAHIQARADTARQAMESAQAAANAEGKSSMGDKYETTRAMMHAERNRAAQSLDEALTLLAELDRIEKQAPRALTTVQPGSLVQTSQGWFFIAVPAGKLTVEGQEVFAVSPQSPIAKLLSSLKAGATYQHQNRQYKVLAVS